MMNSHPTNPASNNPLLGIETTPELTNAEKRTRRAASLAGVGLLAAPSTGVAKHLGKGLAGKIAIGLACTAIYNAALNGPNILHGFRKACSWLSVFADPEASEVANDLLRKAKATTTPPVDAIADKLPKATIKQRVTGGIVKAEKKIEDGVHRGIDDAEKKAEPLVNNANAAFKKIAGETFPPPPMPPADRPAVPLNGGMGGLPPQPTVWGSVKRGVNNTAKSLYDFSNGLRDEQLKQAERERPMREAFAERWFAQMNASCPWCRKPMHIVPSAHKLRSCSHCYKQFYPNAARNYPPPVPNVIPAQFVNEWKKKHPETAK